MKQGIIIAIFHVSAPSFAALTMVLWDRQHEVLALLIGACTFMVTLALWVRDLYLEEIAESLSPTRRFHGSTVIEPPRPLPAFPDESPSRVRMRPLAERGPYASVAPEDADRESTWPEVG